MDNPLYIFLGIGILLFGIFIGIILINLKTKREVDNAQNDAIRIIEDAQMRAENVIKEARIEGREAALEFRNQAEKEYETRQSNLDQQENKILRREDNLNMRDESLTKKESAIDDREREVAKRLQDLDKMKSELQSNIDKQKSELHRIAELTIEEARKEILDNVEESMQDEIATFMREQEEEAESKAKDVARNIIGTAIQGAAPEESQDQTVSIVSLPNEEMKGRIIGREGRNIKAIEKATGVDLIIDDTPEVITISCFNPIRREVARLALEQLIKDGRIQPGRIEEVVYNAQRELDAEIMKVGEDAVFQLGIGKMDRELVKLVGRLRYRYSYGQNVLDHSLEVAHIAGVMAAELGLNQSQAKRAGLMHDIGKALDFEMEGTHIALGHKVAKKYGEDAVVLNAIASHHGDVPMTNLISNLVQAADTLSAARPGARHESFENYIQRLEALEAIGNSYEGVEETYAIQAGRELRVMVKPDKLNDNDSYKLAKNIKNQIEEELTYPGQVKVTVIRETRASETAK